MSTSLQTPGGDNGEMGQDVELNIASIVDCFTVLITYILAASSFISIGAIDATLASGGGGAATAVAEAKPQVFISMELSDDHTLRLKSVGGDNTAHVSPPKADGQWDFAAAAAQLKTLHERFPAADSLTLLSDDKVQYRDIVHAVATVKKELPVFFVKTESIW